MQIVLSDDNARSIWSTSVYSYTGKGGGPGGGLADDKLRVGGWGDQYVALLQFDLPSERIVRRALLRLKVKGEDSERQPTPMNVQVITRSWRWNDGDRLWWRNLPPSTLMMEAAAPGPAGSTYEIDITAIYNDWASGRHPNHGLILFPVLNNNNYSTFFSTRAQPMQRPSIELLY